MSLALAAAAVCILLAPGLSLAATWQWGAQGQRERLVIQQDIPAQARVTRTGPTTLLVTTEGAAESFSTGAAQGALPGAQALLAAAQPSGQGLELTLRSPAFGYMLSKDGPKRWVLSIFHDPLGARWTPGGALAPASVAEVYHQGARAVPAAAPKVEKPAAAPAALTGATSAAAAPPAAVVAAAPAPQSPPKAPAVSEEDMLLPELEASASLRPEMQEKSPPSLAADLLRNLSLSSTAVAAETARPQAPISQAPISQAKPAQSINGRGVMVSPQEVLGKINTGGPEAWPSDDALSTSLTPQTAPGTAAPSEPSPSPAPPAPSAPPAASTRVTGTVQRVQPPPAAQGAPASAAPAAAVQTPATAPSSPSPSGPPPVKAAPGEVVQMRQSASPAPMTNATASTNATRPVVYVDEGGNVVPKPPDIPALLAEAERLLESTQYKEALAKLEELKALPLPPATREKVLYLISDATEYLYAGDALKGFEPIVSTTSEALNANLRSSRVPDALYRLGMAQVRVGNFNEADGYFNALKRRFPHDVNVPVAFVNLGQALLKKKFYAEAAKNFRTVLQEYPEASVLREAAVGLVRALLPLGDTQNAAVIADFVDKRWPRYYLGDPSFLEVMAQLNLSQGKREEALQQYWLHFNIDPTRESNPGVLATIGDLYLRTNRMKAAMEVFAEIRKRYPNSLEAAHAEIRMAEKGIHDGPVTVPEMFAVFENPGTPEPQVAYRNARKAFPGDAWSVLAGLKLAMWELWKKQYTDAMGAAADFIDLHPEHPDVEQARQVIMQAFMADLKNALAEENYGRILLLWNGFPLVRERYGPVDPHLRNALGRGYLERGEDAKAMELFAEFLKTPKHPQYGNPTFALYFNKYLQAGDWNALLDLGETVKNWDMSADVRGQLDYALALSSENLGLAPKALPLWKSLAVNTQIPLYQRAYATYFLAKDAERRKDIREAYTYNKNTLELFNQLEQERSDKADPERVKEALGSLMDITEVANRIPEALEWVERYNAFVPENSPEFPGLRFREARLYRKLGDASKAKALLELIVQKAADSPFAKAAEAELRTFAVSRDLRNFLPAGQ